MINVPNFSGRNPQLSKAQSDLLLWIFFKLCLCVYDSEAHTAECGWCSQYHGFPCTMTSDTGVLRYMYLQVLIKLYCSSKLHANRSRFTRVALKVHFHFLESCTEMKTLVGVLTKDTRHVMSLDQESNQHSSLLSDCSY